MQPALVLWLSGEMAIWWHSKIILSCPGSYNLNWRNNIKEIQRTTASVTQIQNCVASATMQSTNHYTITALSLSLYFFVVTYYILYLEYQTLSVCLFSTKQSSAIESLCITALVRGETNILSLFSVIQTRDSQAKDHIELARSRT